MHIEEFFRCGSKYYITMPAIRAEKGDVTKDPSISGEDRIRICRSLIHSMARMHEAGLIHGDLKLDNVLITETSAGFYTPKVIDFEDCYWQKESPEPGTDIKCDMSYAAPETFRLMLGEDLQLTQAVDVFALGLLMHALLTGEFPRFEIFLPLRVPDQGRTATVLGVEAAGSLQAADQADAADLSGEKDHTETGGGSTDWSSCGL